MDRKRLPPRSMLHQLLRYDAATGELIWLPRPRELFPNDRLYNSWNTRRAGTVAGSVKLTSKIISIDHIMYRAHRLVWLFVYGEPVPDLIDHIDGDPLNNRPQNLRAATLSQNAANSRRPKDNTSGVKGVSFQYGKFCPFVGYNHRTVWLGTFDTLEEAAAVRREAFKRFYGEFARHE